VIAAQSPANSAACFFVSDLHGYRYKYEKLFSAVANEKPAALFLGGDLLPPGGSCSGGGGGRTAIDHGDFITTFLTPEFSKLKKYLGELYPEVFLILGNDDVRKEEAPILDAATKGVWHYMHNRKTAWLNFLIFGYAYVPPTPFRLKDWERYDVSRYVDPGCIAPEEGILSLPVAEDQLKYTTIDQDLKKLCGRDKLTNAILLFHTPPYKTNLDRVALDGKMIDQVPMDVHIGSIAVRRFIEERRPLITLHGHAHESARLTGSWQDKIGRTRAFSAAHDGPELALVRFDPYNPKTAERELIR
jgi:Icc-related predicted phosphoesterase